MAETVSVGDRLTDPAGNWGTISAMSTGEWVIVSWDDEDEADTVIPMSALVVEEA